MPFCHSVLEWSPFYANFILIKTLLSHIHELKEFGNFLQNLGMETVICQRLDNQGIILLTSSSNLNPRILLYICLMTSIKTLM